MLKQADRYDLIEFFQKVSLKITENMITRPVGTKKRGSEDLAEKT